MIPRLLACAALLASVASAEGASPVKGTPDIKSAGPIAFGPKGVLFVGDPVAGAIFAIETGDLAPDPVGPKFHASDFDKQVVAAVGEEPRFFGRYNDLAINPASGKAYLSFDRGTVRASVPSLVRVDSTGKVEAVPLRDVAFTKVSMPNPAPVDPRRPGPNDQGLSVTDLAFVDGRLYVAGLSGDKFDSRIIPIPYPFPEEADEGTTVEIFQSPSGAFNSTSPIYTLAACRLKGEPHFLAAYSQTPLVTIPVAAIKPSGQVRATTVADLGNRNNPLDSLVYRKGGKEFVIITNTRQGMMKISLDWLAGAPPITSRFVGPGTLPLEKIAELKGITLVERIDDDHALVLGQKSMGGVDLFAIPLP
jgi:hypothetical protein